MTYHGDGPPSTCPGRLRLMFMRACVVTLLVCLLFYTITLTEAPVKITQSLESWNFSEIFITASYKFQNVISQQKIPRERKLVLLWTDFFGSIDWLPSAVDLHCPVTECDVTSNRSLLFNSSAVILHWRNIDVDRLPECVPSKNVSCPLWVLFNKEAPPHTSRDTLEAVQDKVHWTATYRKDSDIFAPYGAVVPRKMRVSLKTDLGKNRRLLCWLVSNCDTPSKREIFVHNLENYIDVDIYGRCGDLKCPHKLVSECYRWLSERCMFYLSLENSHCKDYTTEKLYNALSSDMVPIVMGNSSNYRHLPPRSFINAADFSSPKELAEYLVNVVKAKNLYLSYFEWKKYYEVKDQSYLWFCDLCQKLHDIKAENVKPHDNLVSWWYDQSGCGS